MQCATVYIEYSGCFSSYDVRPCLSDENGMASKLAEALPRLVSATFSQIGKEALEVKVVRLLRRRQPLAGEGENWDDDRSGESSRRKPSILHLIRRAARDRQAGRSKICSVAEHFGKARKHGGEWLPQQDSGETGMRFSVTGFRGMASGASASRNQGEMQQKAPNIARGSPRRPSAESSSYASQPVQPKPSLDDTPPLRRVSTKYGSGETDELFLFSLKDGSNFRLLDVALKFTGRPDVTDAYWM